MRTSRISQDTTRVFHSISTNSLPRRSTRGVKSLAIFSLGHDGTVDVKEEDELISNSDADTKSALVSTPDIEETLSHTLVSSVSRKRKYGTTITDSSRTQVRSTVTERTRIWTSPRKLKIEDESDAESYDEGTTPTGRVKAKPKIPARKVTTPDGSVTIHPPSNWDEIYSIIHAMRKRNPTAPVDTMGCEDLFWDTSPSVDKRYHTLTALMLSSQTKDTVTAVAMARLHTELIRQAPDPKTGKIERSGLTIENIIGSDPKWLDELIGKVGFHNNKTKYIKQTALILRDEYNSEVPDTLEGLLRLPGVGPKMAYLCLAGAWGKVLGIGVDVHVHRITNLWGWHKTKNPEETRHWLEGWLPKEKWHEINKMLVGLGQTVCLPIGRKCGMCDLAGTGLCKSEVRGVKVKERRQKIETVKAEGDHVKMDVVEEHQIRVKEELADD